MAFILNKNKYGLVFDEDAFVWQLNKEEASYKDVLESLLDSSDFDSISVATVEDETISVEFGGSSWRVNFDISASKGNRVASEKYLLFVNFYAEDEDEMFDEFEYSGPMIENNQYVVADSAKEAFDMLGSIFNVLLSKLEIHCSNGEDEEDEEE